ncbi:hypothetical protein ACFY00_34455 [Kitasatospora sp. NPDC001540]|uniref:hypothetical protein n=1 Tax=Kitasatospora sp. NPDC001540 TaxID=3364014 RepID=UPI00369A5818
MATEETTTRPDVLEPLRSHLRDPSYEFEVGAGWWPLVLQCHLAVVAEFPGYELLAVKQKLGSLAFQASPSPAARTSAEFARLAEVIGIFARRSASVCERCGGVGMLRRSRPRIMLVLCHACESLVPGRRRAAAGAAVPGRAVSSG